MNENYELMLDDTGNLIVCLEPDYRPTIGQIEEEYVDVVQDTLKELKRLREENGVLARTVKEDNKILKEHIETLEAYKRVRRLLRIERRIVQAFCDYRDFHCYEHCEAWMLEKGHRVMVKYGNEEQSEWKVEVE